MSARRRAEESGPGAWQVFTQDLARALHVWRTVPLLPLCSVILTVVGILIEDVSRQRFPEREAGPVGSHEAFDYVSLIVLVPMVADLLFTTGWVGTERVWYLRAYRGKATHPGELWRLTLAFVVRYVLLGLLASSPLWLIIFLRVWQVTRTTPVGSHPSPPYFSPIEEFLLSLVFVVLMDVLLTFVTPALAYTTRRVGKALGIGWGMLRDEWPRSAGYALVPPLALLLTSQTLPESILGRFGRLVLGVVFALLNLWFKGATAAFYLRRYDAGDDGAAFAPRGV